MAQQIATTTLFEDLFLSPSIPRMLSELDSSGFEDFVEYVFQRAGYVTKNVARPRSVPGVDIVLSLGNRPSEPIAYVQVKHFTPDVTKVGGPEVREFAGSPNNTTKVARYLVTTSDFAQTAYDDAAKVPRMRLLNGQHFLRYITYIRESRHPVSSAPAIAPDWLFLAEGLERRPAKKTRILSVANNKGGVGKTTTALNVALGLADRGCRVLLVDLDGQANLSDALLGGAAAHPPHLGDYLMSLAGPARLPLAQLIRPTEFKRVWLIPAHRNLRLIDQAGTADTEAELRFIVDLHHPDVRPPQYPDPGEFDWIILDTPPAMTFNTRAALGASHFVMAPSKPSAFGSSGLKQLLDTASAMRALLGSGVQVMGCLVTHWQKSKVLDEALANLQDRLRNEGVTTLKTQISYDLNIDKAQAKRTSIFDLLRRPGTGATEYRALVEELITYVDGN